MRKLLLLSLLTVSVNFAYAKKNCTNEPQDKWMKIEEFKELAKSKGFKIRKFKQPGSCYEIYGKDKDGKEVEVYFNPVNAKIVKVEFED